jgi:hypothetical protein
VLAQAAQHREGEQQVGQAEHADQYDSGDQKGHRAISLPVIGTRW